MTFFCLRAIKVRVRSVQHGCPDIVVKGVMKQQQLVFKICPRIAWDAAVISGSYTGSPDDERDGFIHLSDLDQLPGTAAKHFRDQTGLVLIAFLADDFGSALRWETSRGGALFPHLYAPLDPKAARYVRPLELGRDGVPIIPGDLDKC
jgi:uncharacterized protein (DUF952 family)